MGAVPGRSTKSLDSMMPRDPTIVRVLTSARWNQPLPIFSGDPPEPITPDWAAIAYFPGTKPNDDRFVLRFLTADGVPLEHLQFLTLDVALAEAEAIAGISPNKWGRCEILIPEDVDFLSLRAVIQKLAAELGANGHAV
jgi:hypothetical protein